MIYLEVLRARRVLTNVARIVAIGVALGLFFWYVGASHGTIVVQNGDVATTQTPHESVLQSIGDFRVPMALIFGIAGLLALPVAIALSFSFNVETSYAHFTFVRPISRRQLGARMAVVDVLAIALAYVAMCAVSVLVLIAAVGSRAHLYWDADAPAVAVQALGAAVMWYAISQALSAWYPGRGGWIAGVATGFFAGVPGIAAATFLGPIASLAGVLLYLDPMAYVASVSIHGDGIETRTLMGLPPAGSIALAWGISLVALALATIEWQRVEV